MTETAAGPDPADAFYTQLAAGELEDAAATLDAAPDLPDDRRAVLAAELALARGRPVDALAAVSGCRPELPRVAALLARAHLASGSPRDALDAIARATRQTPKLALLAVQAQARLGDPETAHEAAEDALALHPEEPGLVIAALVGAVRAGDEVRAEALLAAAAEHGRQDEALTRFGMAALASGRADWLEARRDRYDRRLIPLHLMVRQTLAALAKSTDPLLPLGEEDRPVLIATIERLCRSFARPDGVFRIARSLAAYGEPEASERCLAHYETIRHAPRTPAVEPDADAGHGLTEDKLDALAQWIGVDSDVEAWKAQVRAANRGMSGLSPALHKDPDVFERWCAEVTRADWSCIHRHRERGEPAFVACTHTGFLVRMLAQLALDPQLDILVFGGAQVDRLSYPFGDRFVPTPKTDTETLMARRLMRLIRDGKRVAIAGDVPRGARHIVRMNGCALRLPESIPRMAWRHDVPVYFAATFLRDDRYVCEIRDLPASLPGEPYEEFRDRWALAYLGCIRDAARADPRNVRPFGAIRLL